MVQFHMLPETQRRPKTSYLIGQALGDVLGGASNLYLQNKIEGYFKGKDEERKSAKQKESAIGLSKMVGRPDLEDFFSQQPLETHQAVALQWAKNAMQQPSRAGLGKVDATKFGYGGQSMGEEGQPQQMTPSNIATQIAAEQRNPQVMPGLPGYPQGVGIGASPFQPLQQQYQPAMGEEAMQQPQEQPSVLPSGAIAPQAPQIEQGVGEMPSWHMKDPNNEMTDAEYQEYSQLLTPKEKKEQDRLRLASKGISARERTAATAEERTEIARKNQELNERKFQNLLNEKLEKSKELTKEDKEFVKRTHAAHQAAFTVNNTLDEMKEIRENNNIGFLSGLTEEDRTAKSRYDVKGKDLIPIVRDILPKLTQQEFLEISKNWLPHSGENAGKQLGKEQGFRDLAKQADKIYDVMDKYKNKDGSYPKNIESKVHNELKSIRKETRQMLHDGPKQVFIKDDLVEELPDASSVGIGEGFEDDKGNVYVSNGKKWTKRKK